MSGNLDKYKEAVKNAFRGKYGKEFDELMRRICETENFGLKSSCETLYFIEGKRYVYQTLKRMMEEDNGR